MRPEIIDERTKIVLPSPDVFLYNTINILLKWPDAKRLQVLNQRLQEFIRTFLAINKSYLGPGPEYLCLKSIVHLVEKETEKHSFEPKDGLPPTFESSDNQLLSDSERIKTLKTEAEHQRARVVLEEAVQSVANGRPIGWVEAYSGYSKQQLEEAVAARYFLVSAPVINR